MINLGNSSFYDLLPPNLRDAHTRALSYAADRQFAKLATFIQAKTLIYAGVMALDEEVCDHLALQFKLQAYDMSFSLQMKRELLAICFLTNLKKGTIGAVKQVISTIHGGAEITEWFQYAGTPHTFRINVDSTKQSGFTEKAYERLLENIFEYKALRSTLEGLTIKLRSQAHMYIGGAIIAGESAAVKPRIKQHRTGGVVGVGGACVAGESTAVIPRLQDKRLHGRLCAGGAVVSGECGIYYPVVPNRRTRSPVYAGGALVAGEGVGIIPKLPDCLRGSGMMAPGGALVAGEGVSVIPNIPSRLRSSRCTWSGGAVVSGEAIVLLPLLQSALQIGGQIRAAGAVVAGEHTIIKAIRMEASQ